MADMVQVYIDNEREEADLIHKIVGQYPHQLTTSGSMDMDYQDFSSLGVTEYSEFKHTPLPQELTEQLQRMESTCGFGIFPEISRAWLTVDTDIFLWNFELVRDLAFYDQIQNTILKVALSNLKLGVFPLPCTQALVVATTADLYLLGVSFGDEAKQQRHFRDIDPASPNLFLLLEELHRISLDGLMVTDIACTQDGRIFFSAENDVYELDYYVDRWFGRTVKKVHQTKSYIPNPLSLFQTKGCIVQLCVDDTRHVMYALTDQSTITVFDLGTNGTEFKKVASTSLDQIVDAITLDKQFVSQLVAISPIPSSRSLYVCLEAVTSFGVRIYFTCLEQVLLERGQNRERVRPRCIRPIHVRFPTSNMSLLKQQQSNIYYSKTDQDSTIMAMRTPLTENNVLLALSSMNLAYTNRFMETSTKLSTDGQVIWAMARSADRLCLEQSQRRETAVRLPTMEEIELVPALQPPLFTQQHIFPVDKVHVVTPAGVITLGHYTPVEVFRQILERYGTESKQLHNWIKIEGAVEVCVQALIVICSEKHGDLNIREKAIRTLFTLGGQPELINAQGQSFQQQQQQQQQQRLDDSALWAGNQSLNDSLLPAPIHASTPCRPGTLPRLAGAAVNVQQPPQLRPSHRHDALYIHFARLVYFVWNRNVVCREHNQLVSGLYLKDLRLIVKYVALYRHAIKQFSLIGPTRFSNVQMESEVVEREYRSLERLCHTIDLTLEFMNLWILLLEHDFGAVVGSLPTDVHDFLLKCRFNELLSNAPEKVGVELISALIKLYLNDEAATESLNNRLVEECPKLFTNEDAAVLQAVELLLNARAVQSLAERESLIQRSMQILFKHADRVDMSQASQLLRDLQYYVGIVDLALARAKIVDPRDYAKIVYRKQLQELGEMQQAVERRTGVYNIVVDTLNLLHRAATSNPTQDAVQPLNRATAQAERDQIISRITHSDDEICQVVLFRWLIENGLEEKVLSEPNPTLEHFIYTEIENDGSMAYFDMLWRYYKGTDEYAKAAQLLYDLATKKAKSTNFEKKLEFLSQALVCINCAPESQPNVQLKASIRDWLDVARVQQQAACQLEAEAGRRFDAATVARVVEELRAYLVPASELFGVAEKFDLPLLKLSVLHVVGHYEEEQVDEIYKRIVSDELSQVESGTMDPHVAGRSLSTKLGQLKKAYAAAPKYFPTKTILYEMLQFALRSLGSTPQWVWQLCEDADIPQPDLIDQCLFEYRVADPFWRRNRRARRFMADLAQAVCNRFLDRALQMSPEERKLMRTKCLEFVDTLFLDARDNGDNADGLEVVQARLDQVI